MRLLPRLLVVASAVAAPWSHAQILQLGPFAFDAQTRLEAIYTTNVEQERKSEATADRQDYYLVWGLDLKSTTDFLPRTKVSVDTGIAIEKHFNRPDLDNSENPFGRFSAQFDTDLSPLTLNGTFSYESTSESTEDAFVPKDLGISRKKRQTGTTLDYGAGANWNGERLTLGANYQMTKERFDDDEYFLTENDAESIGYIAGIKLVTIKGIGIGATYSVDYTYDTLINVPEETDEKTETITLDFDTLELWERPKITYSIGMQREYTEGESEGWELVQTIAVSDEYDFSPTLNLKADASYNWEETPEEDDVEFQYGATLTHEISPRAQQTLSATRAPVDTLGSTTDTDERTFGYSLNIQDFLFKNIAFSWSADYTISIPVEGDEERIWTYALGLKHSIPITARITRSIGYDYTREDSNLEDELLEEHRITLSFVYQL